MRIFAALVWREIAERRLLLLAGLLLGFVPIVLPFLPGIPTRIPPEEMRTAATIGLAAVFGGLSLLILGSTIVGRDLSDRRLGFFFSRPISSGSLWLSRIVAALLLVVTCVLLILAPTTFVDAGAWMEPIWGDQGKYSWPILTPWEKYIATHFLDDWPIYRVTPERFSPLGGALFGGAMVLLVLAFVHAVSTMVRGRNLWVLADLAGGIIVLGLAWSAREGLLREQALGALVWAERLFVPLTLTAFLVAGGVQLARGRTDLARGHRYLSMTLWPSLIAVMLAFAAYPRWLASSEIDDLESLARLKVSPDERWLMVGGSVRHRGSVGAAFLFDTQTGTSWRLGSLNASRAWLTFSPDGGSVVWARCEDPKPPYCELWIKDLRDATSPPWPTGIPIDLRKMRWLRIAEDPVLVFNDDGTLLAVAEEERVVVYRIESASNGEATEAAVVAAADADLPSAMAFLPGAQLRFHERLAVSPEATLESGWLWQTLIQQIDLSTRRVVETGRLPAGIKTVRSPDRETPDRDTIFYQRRMPLGFGIYDGESGDLLAQLDPYLHSIAGSARFLADGRLVFDHWSIGKLTFLVVSPDGEELHRIERHNVRDRRFGGELAPGRLLIALQENLPESPAVFHPNDPEAELEVVSLEGWTTYVLDADSGELTPLASKVLPLGKSGVSNERLFLAGGGEIFRWRPESDERQTILTVGS